jgi:integrase
MHVLTREQCEALLEAESGKRLEALYHLVLGTGMRVGELLALHWADTDLDAGSLQVRRSVRYSGHRLVWSEAKTKRSRRRLALSDEPCDILRHHRARQAEERLRIGGAWQDNDLVFCTAAGTPIESGNLLRSFRLLLQRAGLPRVRLHDLPHTAATLALAGRVNPKVVSEMLGHASVSITLDIYSHVLPDMQQDAAATIAGLLYGSRRGLGERARK